MANERQSKLMYRWFGSVVVVVAGGGGIGAGVGAPVNVMWISAGFTMVRKGAEAACGAVAAGRAAIWSAPAVWVFE
jgi:hypothetical protein